MRFLYDAHIPFVVVFALAAIAFLVWNWKERKSR
jgi:hypothetical protein